MPEGRPAKHPPPSPAKLLILSFEPTDLDFLAQENKAVAEAFESIRVPSKFLHFNSDESQYFHDLKSFLRRGSTPRIIYVNGHGEDQDGELVLRSHRKDGTSMPWSTVEAIVEPAECDVLVIVDCCHAGLASLRGNDKYTKEMITATSWGEATYDRLAPALSQALVDWGKKSKSQSAQSLHTYLEDELKSMRDKEVQAKAQQIQARMQDQAKLEKKMARLRIKEADLDRQIEDLQKEQGVVKNAIKDCEDSIVSSNTEMDRDKEALKSIKAEHPQPHYNKKDSCSNRWRLRRSRRSKPNIRSLTATRKTRVRIPGGSGA